ncbi:MAG: PadR family transcriptional regulator [Thermomicrobiales bacterium]
MATTRKTSNLLALAVLSLLAERPTHPYEMDFLMRSRGLAASIKLNRGSLYTVVEMLQREGLIVPQETQREGRRPERTVYALTEAGATKFAAWHRELLRKPAKEYTQFAAGLALIAHIAPDEVIALLEERVGLLEDAAEEMRFHLTSIRERLGVPRLFLIEEEYAQMLREAELAWVRAMIREIREGTLVWPKFVAENDAPARFGTERAVAAPDTDAREEEKGAEPDS